MTRWMVLSYLAAFKCARIRSDKNRWKNILSLVLAKIVFERKLINSESFCLLWITRIAFIATWIFSFINIRWNILSVEATTQIWFVPSWRSDFGLKRWEVTKKLILCGLKSNYHIFSINNQYQKKKYHQQGLEIRKVYWRDQLCLKQTHSLKYCISINIEKWHCCSKP